MRWRIHRLSMDCNPPDYAPWIVTDPDGYKHSHYSWDSAMLFLWWVNARALLPKGDDGA